MYHLKFLAVAKVEAVRPVHLAKLLHLPEARAISFADGKIKLRAADNRVAAGRDLQGIMNLLPLQAPMDRSF